MTRLFRSSPITEPSSQLRSGPPLSGASVLSALRLEPLAFSLAIAGSDVPYRSLIELRAAYTPDGQDQGIPRARPGRQVSPQSRHRLKGFDASAAVRLRSPLSTMRAGSGSRLFRDAHEHGF